MTLAQQLIQFETDSSPTERTRDEAQQICRRPDHWHLEGARCQDFRGLFFPQVLVIDQASAARAAKKCNKTYLIQITPFKADVFSAPLSQTLLVMSKVLGKCTKNRLTIQQNC